MHMYVHLYIHWNAQYTFIKPFEYSYLLRECNLKFKKMVHSVRILLLIFCPACFQG